MTEKRERFGCISKSLEDFLDMTEDERFEKHKYDVNKYYQRVIKNVNRAVWDLTFAYEKLPTEQRKKIDLLNHADDLVGYLTKTKLQGNPKKIIRSTKKQLLSIIENYVRSSPRSIRELMEQDFDRVYKWLDYLTPKNPNEKGAPV